MRRTTPKLVGYGEWHLPLVPDYNELREEVTSTTIRLHRFAGPLGALASPTSPTTEKRDPGADIMLYEKLVSSGHMSPLEHVAIPCNQRMERRLRRQLLQLRFNYRKTIPGEQDFSLRPKEAT